MAIIAVNALNGRLEAPDTVTPALMTLATGDRIVIMVHGFRYAPHTDLNDPHRQLFSGDVRKSSWKAVSWSHYLKLNQPNSGLGIGFGWNALGRLDLAAARAFDAGDALAELINHIHLQRPDLHIRVMAHSLGVRVALRALQQTRARAIETMVLLSGAEYRAAAAKAMASEAGQSVRIVNVTSGENLVFDTLFRIAAPGRDSLAPSLSGGLGIAHPRWLDLRIDHAPHLAALRGLGYRPAKPAYPICHWSSFIRPGLFPCVPRPSGRTQQTQLCRAFRRGVGGASDPPDPARPAHLRATRGLRPRWEFACEFPTCSAQWRNAARPRAVANM